MDIIVDANVFITKMGEIVGKAKARYVTQNIAVNTVYFVMAHLGGNIAN